MGSSSSSSSRLRLLFFLFFFRREICQIQGVLSTHLRGALNKRAKLINHIRQRERERDANVFSFQFPVSCVVFMNEPRLASIRFNRD